MGKITFSIITVTFNRVSSGYLDKCIQSVQAQKIDGVNYEHIIIDDGSTDNTAEVVGLYQKKDPRIKYYYQENAGLAKAFSAAIQLAQGDYLFKIDDDDELSKDSLKHRMNFIKKNKNIDWFYGLAEWVDEHSLPTQQLYQSQYFDEFAYERMLISNYIHGGTETIRTSVAKRIEWPEWLIWSQDYFMWLELLRPEKKLKKGFLNEVLLTYRYHSASYTAGVNSSAESRKKKHELNKRIKSELHPAGLAFLANEAFQWSEEAQNNNTYWQKQIETRIRPLEKKIVEYEDKINSYRLSRVIGPVIRFRDNRHKIKPLLQSLPKRTAKKLLGGRSVPLFVDQPRKEITIAKEEFSKDRPLISIITPFYNRQDTMPETVRSVLSQTFQNFEYIIVDDGSTMPEATEYLSKVIHPKIKIIKQKNQGVATARNTGIRHSKGKYVVCLDSDDIIDPTFIEKALVVLETNPEVSLVTFDTKMFGAINDYYFYKGYDPFALLEDNLIQTAAVFKREAWEKSGGYKNEIGYEDWEYWVNLTENGFFGKHIKESLFHYRTAHNSRYIDDLEYHNDNAAFIKLTHPNYVKNVQKELAKVSAVKQKFKTNEYFTYMSEPEHYRRAANNKPNVLIAVPWMTFGGAETLIANFCKEIATEFNLAFITGLASENEWEYKFREITTNIFHLNNLFENDEMYLEFVSNYIKTRNIQILHIIHTSFVYDMLPILKQRHPDLKVVVTVFNTVAHFKEAVEADKYIDEFTSDNRIVTEEYKLRTEKLEGSHATTRIIPNGINSKTVFVPDNSLRESQRQHLGLRSDDIGVFFIGRLSEEKNPDVFIKAAKQILNKNRKSKIKFFIIGDGVMGQVVRDEVSGFGSSRLRYLGYQSDIARFLSAADVFVLPSSTEGFPLSIIEAMAMKVAVIASKVGAIPDVIEEGGDGFLITPGSADEISDVIRKLDTDRTLLEKIKQNARKKVEEKYSNEILGKNYMNLYRRLLK